MNNSNAYLKEPLVKTEKDILFDLNSLSVQFLKAQSNIEDLGEIFDDNPTQNDYSKGQYEFFKQQEKISEYTTQFTQARAGFLLLPKPSYANRTKFDKAFKKIDNLINTLETKCSELTEKIKKVKSVNNFEEKDAQISISHNSTISFEQKAIEKNVVNQRDYLEKRAKEIDEAKIVSGQLVAMSKHINEEVKAQGDNLEEIENEVNEVKENADKAENEIEEAEKINKDKTKMVICIILVVVFVVVAIAGTVVTIFLI